MQFRIFYMNKYTDEKVIFVKEFDTRDGANSFLEKEAGLLGFEWFGYEHKNVATWHNGQTIDESTSIWDPIGKDGYVSRIIDEGHHKILHLQNTCQSCKEMISVDVNVCRSCDKETKVVK